MEEPEIIKIEYASKRGDATGCLAPEGSEICAECRWRDGNFDEKMGMEFPESAYVALGHLVATFASALGDPDEIEAPTPDQVAWDGILMALNQASIERMATLQPHFELVSKLGVKLPLPNARYQILLGPNDLAQLAQVATIFRDALSKALKISILTPLLRQRGIADLWGPMDLLARSFEAAAPKCYLRTVPSVSDASKPCIYS